MTAFAHNLRLRARLLGFSDAEVARRAGLSERRYGHYVAGAREPDLATLLRICAALAATPNDLLFESPEERRDRTARQCLLDRLTAAVSCLDDPDIALAVDLVEAVMVRRRRS